MSDLPTGSVRPLQPDESLDSSILHVLMETLPDRIYFKDLESRFVRVNRSQALALGAAAPADCVGRTDFDYFSREHAERARADELEIIRTGRPLVGKVERTTLRDGAVTWVTTTKVPWQDDAGRIIGTYGLTRDFTAARQAEERLTEERNLLRTIIDHLPARIFVKDAASRYLLNNVAHLRALGVTRQEEAVGRTTEDFYTGERGRQAMADDHQVLADGASIIGQEKSDFAADGNVHWSLTTKVPLRNASQEVVGLVGISHDITQRKRTEQELQRRTEEMEADLRIARQIQEAFFPRAYPVFPPGIPPERSRLRFAHRYLPAASLGGDFFDILPLSGTKCGVLVCDVMGHGVRAGLLTALIRGGVEEIGHRSDDPAYVLGEINRSLIPVMEQTGSPVFATAFYGVVDLAAGTLTYGNAGHPPPVVRTAAGAVERLAAENPEPAAGVIEDFAYTNTVRAFRPGDLLVAYTDGLFESCDTCGAMFGQNRLEETVRLAPGLSVSGLIDRVMGEVADFTGHAVAADDICIVVVEATTAV